MCLPNHYLSGRHNQDIVQFVGISPVTFYYCLEKTMLAIINCPQLQIVFPTSEGECEELATGFHRILYKHAIVNCVGCVDGYLLGINVPPRKDAGNVHRILMATTTSTT
jgi:hypothetical protein